MVNATKKLILQQSAILPRLRRRSLAACERPLFAVDGVDGSEIMQRTAWSKTAPGAGMNASWKPGLAAVEQGQQTIRRLRSGTPFVVIRKQMKMSIFRNSGEISQYKDKSCTPRQPWRAAGSQV
jgi:hypothetical protein